MSRLYYICAAILAAVSLTSCTTRPAPAYVDDDFGLVDEVNEDASPYFYDDYGAFYGDYYGGDSGFYSTARSFE